MNLIEDYWDLLHTKLKASEANGSVEEVIFLCFSMLQTKIP